MSERSQLFDPTYRRIKVWIGCLASSLLCDLLASGTWRHHDQADQQQPPLPLHRLLPVSTLRSHHAPHPVVLYACIAATVCCCIALCNAALHCVMRHCIGIRAHTHQHGTVRIAYTPTSLEMVDDNFTLVLLSLVYFTVFRNSLLFAHYYGTSPASETLC